MKRLACWFFVLLATLLASPAVAHKPSDSYLRIQQDPTSLKIEWDIALRDLEMLVGLDADADGRITWAEVKQQQAAILGHALSRLTVRESHAPLAFTLTGMLATQHSDGGYAVLQLSSEAPVHNSLSLDYRLLFDIDPTHRGLVLYQSDQGQSTHVLSADSQRLTLTGQPTPWWQTLRQYTREGVWHIWIGLDHILFLLALLIPAVLWRSDQHWAPVQHFGPACWNVLKIVTMFTLAHSITLWLAVMDLMAPPSRLIESAIALSIVVTALNNLRPTLPLSNSAIAFVFGLVHGFGFANVLMDLGLGGTSLGLALFGFNLGVELGQMAIVLAFMPVAYALRSGRFYEWGVLRTGSLAVAVIALIWFYERAFNAQVLGI